MKKIELVRRRDEVFKHLLVKKRNALLQELSENETYQRLMSSGSALEYAKRHHVNTRGEKMTFDQSHYLLYLYSMIDSLPNMVVEKSVQTGLSELYIIQSHIESGVRGMTVMYVLPKYEQRNRFVNNRIYKLHRVVERYQELIEEADTKVHRTSLMHFGKGTLAYVGSNVADEFIEIPVDSAYVDEKDKCNQINLLYLPDRLTASPYKFHREIGNPTVEGFGIDERYQESSQGVWMIKDPHNGEWFQPDFFTHMVKEVGHNQFIALDPEYVPHETEPRLIGPSGKPVDRLAYGEYVHTYPKRQWKGFRVSQVMSRYVSMDSMIREWYGAVGNELKQQIFYNSRCGRPYSAKGAKITDGVIQECKRNYSVPVGKVNARSVFMGVDVGASLHVVIRERVLERDRRVNRLVDAVVIPGFKALGQLIHQYGPRVVVIDAMPEIHKIMELKEEFDQVYSSKFQNDALKIQIDKKAHILSMDRTALLDFLKESYDTQEFVLPANVAELANGEFVKQLKSPTRILSANEENPEKSRYEWVHKSPDHFFLADAYCYQATMMVPDWTVFEFFESESSRVRMGEALGIDRDASSGWEEREELVRNSKVFAEGVLNELRRVANKEEAVKSVPAQSAVFDSIDYLYESFGYVDVHVLVGSVSDRGLLHFTVDDARRSLIKRGFKESRIRGQFVK